VENSSQVASRAWLQSRRVRGRSGVTRSRSTNRLTRRCSGLASLAAELHSLGPAASHGAFVFATDDEITELLSVPRRIAVLGIKPGSHQDRPAFFIPALLSSQGHSILPVTDRFPGTTSILGSPVYTSLSSVPPPVDILSLFLRPEQMPAHLPDILHALPRYAWFQSGYLNQDVADVLHARGTGIIYDCILCRAALLGRGQAYPYAANPEHKHGGA